MKSFRHRYFPGVSDAEWNDHGWQLSNSVATFSSLSQLLEPTERELAAFSGKTPPRFSITPYYLSLIDPDDPDDPVRRQCVPAADEFLDEEGLPDPLGEGQASAAPGVVKKYPDRALFNVTSICPVYCRHCFRRAGWEGGQAAIAPSKLDLMVDYVRGHGEIREVILSGGDPLSLRGHLFERLLDGLRNIPHLEIIRVASRFPVVLPQKITKGFSAMLGKHFPVWFVTHFNHPNEITGDSALACRNLLEAGVPVLNQAVLLRGVNDKAETLEELFRGLLRIGVKPYYLLQCDPVRGAAHFRTPVSEGVRIMERLHGRLSGLGLPVFALDTEGGGKVPLSPDYLLSAGEGILVVRNFEGKVFEYRDPHPEKREERLAPVPSFDTKS